MLVTVPTVTSLTRTREFCWRFCTSGICAWTVYEPGPPPLVPGNLNEFAPWKPHPDSAATASTTASPLATRSRCRKGIIVHLRAAPSSRAGRRLGWPAPVGRLALLLPVASRRPLVGHSPGAGG